MKPLDHLDGVGIGSRIKLNNNPAVIPLAFGHNGASCTHSMKKYKGFHTRNPIGKDSELNGPLPLIPP